MSLRNRVRFASKSRLRTRMFVCARTVCLRRPGKRADGGSKVVVLTQIKQHLVRVLTSSPPRRPHPLLSLSLFLAYTFSRILCPYDNADNGNVTCARSPTAGNTALQTRMQIHLGMHFNTNYRDANFNKTLWLNQRRAVMMLPIARFARSQRPMINSIINC